MFIYLQIGKKTFKVYVNYWVKHSNFFQGLSQKSLGFSEIDEQSRDKQDFFQCDDNFFYLIKKSLSLNNRELILIIFYLRSS